MSHQEQSGHLLVLSIGEGSIMNVPIQQLTFFAAGLQHLLFQLPSQENKDAQLLIFSRAKKTKDEPGKVFDQKIQGQFDEIYHKIIQKYFPVIHPFIVKKSTFQIINKKEHQIELIFNKLDQKINKQKVGKYIPSKDYIKINRRITKVMKCKNILKQFEYNTIVQFKPKSVLPDLYPVSYLKELSQQFQISFQKLKKILKQADPVEKLRWYKKMKSGSQKGQKFNMNPLITFGIDRISQSKQTKQKIDFTKTKNMKKIESYSEEDSTFLNNQIRHLLREHDRLLLQISKIQNLFNSSPEMIKKQEHSEQEKIVPKWEEISLVIQGLLAKSPEDISYFANQLQRSECICEALPEDWSYECRLFLFLISYTWRDISLIYVGSIQDKKVLTQRFYIVDDYLKSYFQTVDSNCEKDRKFLRNYLWQKLNIGEQ